MTALVTSIVAIVLFGMIMVATVSYGDSLGMMSTVEATSMAQRMQSAAAMVSQVQQDTGSRPTSFAELKAAGFPDEIMESGAIMSIECTDERCSPMRICMTMPATSENVMAARSAAARVHGIMSGTCGDGAAAIGGEAVITLSI